MKVTKEYLRKVILQEVSRSKMGIDPAEIDRTPASADDLGPRSAGYIDRTPRNRGDKPSMYGSEYDKEYSRKQQAYSTAADLNRLRVSIINGLEKVDPKLKQRVVELDKELKQLNSELMKSFDYGDPDDRDSMPIATDETREISAQIKTKERELDGILTQYSKMGNKVKGTLQTLKDKFKKAVGLKENTVKITKQKLVRIIKEEIMKEMNSGSPIAINAKKLVELLRESESEEINKIEGDIIGFINSDVRPTSDAASTQAENRFSRYILKVSFTESGGYYTFEVMGEGKEELKSNKEPIFTVTYEQIVHAEDGRHEAFENLFDKIQNSAVPSTVPNEF